jgi:hypothetical protein
LKDLEKAGTAKKHCQTAHFHKVLQHQEFLRVAFVSREYLTKEWPDPKTLSLKVIFFPTVVKA